jgi:hypothetical protein
MEQYLRKPKLTREEITQKLLQEAPLRESIELDKESSDYYMELLAKDEIRYCTPPKKRDALNFSIDSTESLYLQDSPYRSVPGSEEKKSNSEKVKEANESDGNKAVSSTMSMIDSKSNTILAGTSDADQQSLYQSFLSGKDSFFGVRPKDNNLNLIELGEVNDSNTDLSFKVMKILFDELNRKEEMMYKTNAQLFAEKNKIYPKKSFLIFEDQITLLDSLIAKDNYSRISTTLFKGVVLCDPHQKFKLYICYSKSALWEFIKVTALLNPNTQQLYYKIKTVRLYDLGLNVKFMEKTIEDIVLKTFREKNITCSPLDYEKLATSREKISCSHKETGVFTFKILAKSLFGFTEECSLRKQVYNILLDLYFNSPFSH